MNPNSPKPWLFPILPKQGPVWSTFFPLAVIFISTVLIGTVKVSWLCKFLTNIMTFAWLRQAASLRQQHHLSSSHSNHHLAIVLGTRMLLVAASLVPFAMLAGPFQFYSYHHPQALLFYLLTFGSNAGAFMLIHFLSPRIPSFAKQGLIQLVDLILCPLLFHQLAHIKLSYLYASEDLVMRLVITGLLMLLQTHWLHTRVNFGDRAQKCFS